MKKTMILAAFAALISLASCQKEEVIDNNATDNQASPVFTASIAGATRTTVNLTDGKVAWEESDEITITDASSASAVYTIESIDATTGKATFVIKEGESAIGAGPYTATYGTEPATSQTYSATAGKLYMTAATAGNSFTFTVQCGLMKLNLTKTGESVKSIAVSNSTATYTLTCDPAQSIATAKDFCIALPAGSYTKIEITNAEDITCTLNSTNGVEVATNHIKPVTFDGSKLNFAPVIPAGVISSEFSVSATKKVYFSQGNLYYDGSEFQFEAHQYDFPTTWDASHVGYFLWNSDASASINPSYYNSTALATSYVIFTNETETTAKADFTVNGITGRYRTLSAEEWESLLESHSFRGATVNGVKGFVLAPDGFAGTLAESYADDAALAAAGNLVFLPAAGKIEGGFWDVGGFGYYWSSCRTYDPVDEYAKYVLIDGEYSEINDFFYQFSCCIRLVTDVQ